MPKFPPLRTAGLALVAAAGQAFAVEPAATPPVPAPATAPPSDVQPATDARAAANAEFRKAYDARDYDAAVEQARRVVELTEREPAASPDELQVALMNLAVVQQLADDYVSAEATYRRVIELIEASGRLTRPRLARAYAGLAVTYHAAGRHDLAADAFEHAIALNRRAEGLFNEGQLPLLEKHADALTELGRVEEAKLAHRYALQVVGRRHGERSLPYARQFESLGRWYTRVGAYEASRATLRQATQLTGSIEGADTAALVGPLTAYAENARRWLLDPQWRETGSVDESRRAMFHDQSMLPPSSLSSGTIAAEGLKALEAAARIVDADTNASPALVAGVHAQLGDWEMARRQPERAVPQYQRAWEAAGAGADGASLRQALFGAPVLIRYLVPDYWDRYARRPPEEVERRNVEIELTVTAAGIAADARVLADAGDERLAAQAMKALETAVYRPRLADGTAVATEGVRFVQPFYVLREAATPVPEPAPPPPPPPPQGGG
jgi:tetratricopeptide (TPR) repeat protein